MEREPTYPIRVVARLTGLSAHVIRAWERRYDAVRPTRTPTRRRLYSQHDVARLRLLREAVDGGRRISDVAHLGLDELKALVDGDRSSMPHSREPATDSPQHANVYLQQSLEALERLDKNELEESLQAAAIALGTQRLRNDVIVPLIHTLGERWRDGSFRIVHEHLASAVVRSMLSTLSNGSERAAKGPRIVITTPAGEHHELGALLAASAAREIGWDVVYLGANLPADEVVLAARAFGALAVGLSVVHPASSHHVAEELRQIGRNLDPGVRLIVGGRAAARLKPVLGELDAHYVEDLTVFQKELEALER